DGLHQQNLSVEESSLRILQMPLLAASSFPRSEALSIRSPGLIRMIVRLAAAVPAITPGIWVLRRLRRHTGSRTSLLQAIPELHVWGGAGCLGVAVVSLIL